MLRRTIATAFLSCFGIVALSGQNELVIQGGIYLNPGSELHVVGDIHMENSLGFVFNDGLIKLDGNIIKDELSSYISTQSSLIKFQNDRGNIGAIQYIDGDFTGSNAIQNLEINNTATQPLLYQKSGNIQILNELSLTSGVLRTSDIGGGPLYEVRVSNPDPAAITGNLANNFISGNLVRSIQPFTTYFIPVGTDDPGVFSPEPFQLTFRNGPTADLTIRYEEGTTSALPGTPTFCDNDQVIAYNPSGNVSMNCGVGQWIINTTETNFDYDIEIFPSQQLLDRCSFLMTWLAKDGVLTSSCPVQDFAAYLLTDFSTFDIPGIVDPVLPLELISFDATPNSNSIKLFWETQAEINFDGFGIEKSSDGENFEQIAWIQGKGGPNTPASYTFEDNNVQKNTIYYYRLNMVELSGTEKYSEVRTAIIGNLEHISEARVFPNPLNPGEQDLTYTALLSGPISLKLYNSFGQLVFEKQTEVSEGFNNLSLPNIPMGAYHLVLQDELYTRRGTLLLTN